MNIYTLVTNDDFSFNFCAKYSASAASIAFKMGYIKTLNEIKSLKLSKESYDFIPTIEGRIMVDSHNKITYLIDVNYQYHIYEYRTPELITIQMPLNNKPLATPATVPFDF